MSGWATSNRRNELPPGWHKLRAVILRRDGHRCTHTDDNGRRCQARATDVDHIAGRHNHHPTNLTALCGPHHARKSSAEGNAARAELARLRLRPAEPHPGLRRPNDD